jgi:hypothetical protein
VTNEAQAKVDQYVAANDVKYTVTVVAGDDLDRRYGVRAVPSVALIGRDGKVVWFGTGAAPADVIDAELAKLPPQGAEPEPPRPPPGPVDPKIPPGGWGPRKHLDQGAAATPEAWYAAMLAAMRAGDFEAFEKLHTPRAAGELTPEGFARALGQVAKLAPDGKFKETAPGVVKVSRPDGKDLTTLKKVGDGWLADAAFTEN